MLRSALLLLCTAPSLVTSAFAADKASRAAGETTYHAAGCEQCHAADWSGADRGPDLRGVGKRLHRDEIDRQVRSGGGGMPAFGDALTDIQIAQLVDFLEAQKKPVKQPKAKPTAPPTKPKSSDPE